MTTKDYIYLALLTLSAIVFYLNGYYTGVNRSRRMFERVFDDRAEAAPEESELPQPDTISRISFAEPVEARHGHKVATSATIRAVFGKN